MMMDQLQSIPGPKSTDHVVLYTIHKDRYLSLFPQVLAKGLEGIDPHAPFSTVCILSFAKPFVLLKQFVAGTGTTKQVRYIDVLTKQSGQAPPSSECVYVDTPNDLTDISLAISDALSEFAADAVLIESISLLPLYEDQVSTMKFIQMLVTKIRVANKVGIFIDVADASPSCISDLLMFVDAAIEL
jgi:hypothetical protein